MQALLDRGISTRRGVMNMHLEEAYGDQDAYRMGSGLGRSVAAQGQTIILPLFAQMTDADLSLIVKTLACVLR